MRELIERMAEVLPPKPIGKNPLSFVVTPVHAAEMHNRFARLAAALEAAREDVKAVGTVLGGEFRYLRPSHGLPDGTMLYVIDQARGKGVTDEA